MTNINEEDIDVSTAANSTRIVELAISSKGVKYFLAPKYGHVRGIVAVRADGVRIKCPDSLEGGFTDPRNATAAVLHYLQQQGKPRVAPLVAPVLDFRVANAFSVVNDCPIKPSNELEEELLAVAQQLKDNPLTLDAATDDWEDDLEEEALPQESDGVLNLSDGAPDPEGETVTQAALKKRLAKSKTAQ